MTGPGEDTASTDGRRGSPQSMASGSPLNALCCHGAKRLDSARMRRRERPGPQGYGPASQSGGAVDMTQHSCSSGAPSQRVTERCHAGRSAAAGAFLEHSPPPGTILDPSTHEGLEER